LRRPGSRWPIFVCALTGLILTAAFVAIARQGVPFESDGELHNRLSNAAKVLFLVLVVLFGMFQNYVTQKRDR
jgi:cytochrome bd-type quinol oxidase subunit 2